MIKKYKNQKLRDAWTKKVDEYYTTLETVEEIGLYFKDTLKDKLIICPCDKFLKTNQKSNFVVYLQEHKKELDYKELIVTGYDIETKKGISCLDFPYSTGDVVITNPSYSTNMINTLMSKLINVGADFYLLCSNLAIRYSKVFNFINTNKVKCVKINNNSFINQNNELVKTCSVNLYSTFDLQKKPLRVCWKVDWLKQDNIFFKDETGKYLYIPKLQYIPDDYDDWMIVPISFLEYDYYGKYEAKNIKKHIIVNGKHTFSSIVIKKIK